MNINPCSSISERYTASSSSSSGSSIDDQSLFGNDIENDEKAETPTQRLKEAKWIEAQE
ncbi:hypothetical protein HOY82DRAFT_603187 [Tuber indicum]|nr:hypothetical protein HOY82DRAFT_603187 [Tuber indicum]